MRTAHKAQTALHVHRATCATQPHLARETGNAGLTCPAAWCMSLDTHPGAESGTAHCGARRHPHASRLTHRHPAPATFPLKRMCTCTPVRDVATLPSRRATRRSLTRSSDIPPSCLRLAVARVGPPVLPWSQTARPRSRVVKQRTGEHAHAASLYSRKHHIRLRFPGGGHKSAACRT